MDFLNVILRLSIFRASLPELFVPKIFVPKLFVPRIFNPKPFIPKPFIPKPVIPGLFKFGEGIGAKSHKSFCDRFHGFRVFSTQTTRCAQTRLRLT